jgi:5,10-methenyltetrahydrofolate synthetase
MVVSGYWPMKGEPDLRDWLTGLRKRGARVALPRVVEKGRPLRFLIWEEGARLERGVWNIPHPAEAEEAIPDAALAPLVGFDQGRFRLGYGGGYFDRTLASLSPAPRAIGVGYRELEIETIFPLGHDIPMSEVVAV